MISHRLFPVVSSLCVLALAACSITVDLGTQPVLVKGNLPTFVAQTLPSYTQVALSSTPTATPLPTITATPTNVPLPPTLSVSVATTCYGGPSNHYGRVITIRPGTIATVRGRDEADNYWIIEAPGYPGTLCWLSGEYAQVTGDISNVPAPATPLPSIYTLSEPRNLRVSCSSEDLSDDDDDWHDTRWTVNFRWTNTEPDQTAVRVFRDGWLLATLGGRASSYTDVFYPRTHHHRYDVTYGVQAYKPGAVSSIVTINVRRCD